MCCAVGRWRRSGPASKLGPARSPPGSRPPFPGSEFTSGSTAQDTTSDSPYETNPVIRRAKMRKRTSTGAPPGKPEDDAATTGQDGTSRRDFLRAGAVGLVVAAAPGTPAATALAATSAKDVVRNLEPKRKLLKGGIVLTLESTGDFENADVLIEGKKIVAIGPNLGGGGEQIDCSGTIVMPGFISTHHHQYETPARSVIPDGLLTGTWPQESYGSVVQNIWTAGRIGGTGGAFIWDIGRPPMDPEDVYLAELVAALSQLSEGITCAVDTSQASHQPAYTDA